MIRAALRHPVPRNKLITTVALLTVAAAVATAPPARGQGSPMEYFAEQEAENKDSLLTTNLMKVQDQLHVIAKILMIIVHSKVEHSGPVVLVAQ